MVLGGRCHDSSFKDEVSKVQKRKMGLPWWLSAKSPTANAGDMGSISGPGRSHMPQSNQALLNSGAHEPSTEAPHPRAHAPQQEKSLQWESHAPQLESSPSSPQVEKNPHSNKEPHSQK